MQHRCRARPTVARPTVARPTVARPTVARSGSAPRTENPLLQKSLPTPQRIKTGETTIRRPIWIMTSAENVVMRGRTEAGNLLYFQLLKDWGVTLPARCLTTLIGSHEHHFTVYDECSHRRPVRLSSHVNFHRRIR